eukprot:TRINITY_DN9094_c0_g1_i1.p1 TRINITY_DN9094_c0_g1~~TRINITY_DN9094_c0_g1_i1.p1  ORF type:complete len:310 (+),score=37.93 TRINITY_DN9094_c0_g1_i1:66-995(+)
MHRVTTVCRHLLGRNKTYGSTTTAETIVQDLDLTNQVIIITGANSGIGAETARVLALRNAHVIMACRDLNKAQKVKDQIFYESQNDQITVLPLDLGSFQSIREFVNLFNDLNIPLHVLINNAGVMMMPYSKTTDGYEMQFGINHLGHFLLTNLLLPNLKESAPSRVVVVSSIAHRLGRLNFFDYNSDQFYNSLQAYGRSKLANILFTKHLSKTLKNSGVTINALHPGFIDTNLHQSSFLASLFYGIGSPIWKTVSQGAATQVYLAVHPDVANINGRYFADCKERWCSIAARDDELAEKLWVFSSDACGL